MNFIRYFWVILIILLTCSCANQKINKANYIQVDDSYLNKKIFYGTLKAQNSADLSFQTEGKITYLPYTRGDFVKKGEVIARLDDIFYRIRQNEENAKLKEYIIQEEKQKSNFNRLNVLHKEGAISDNDWENADYELQIIKQQINIQKEKVKYIQKEISYSSIIAPYDGYISQKYTNQNSYAKTSEPIVQIIGSIGAQVEIMVDEKTVTKLKQNEKVDVKILNNNYNGIISHISKSSLENGGYLIKIDIENVSCALKEGMSAKVELKSENSIYQLPISYIFKEGENTFVYKIINIKDNVGSIKKEQIITGELNEDKIEIIKGIKNKDYIITNPKNAKEGQKVEI